MNIATQLLFAFGLMLLCLIPAIGILESILQDKKNKEQKIYVLKLNKTGCIIVALNSFIEFATGIIITLIPLVNSYSLAWLILTVPITICLSLDLLLFINYTYFEISRTVTYDSINKVIEIKKRNTIEKIDLQNEVQIVTRYEAAWQWYSAGRSVPPGMGFEKTILITTTNKSYSFANLLIEGSEVEQILMKNEKFFIDNYRQFNFIT